MKIGYARVSTRKQGESLDEQIDILTKAGCKKVFSEVVSGIKPKRSELTAALEYLQEGDTFVITAIDRLGRSLKDLIEIVFQLKKRSLVFHSLKESMDTTSDTGMLMFNMMASVAEFERQLINRRIYEGVQRAHAAGKYKGRAFSIDKESRQHYVDLMKSGKYTIAYITKLAKVSKSTLYYWKKALEKEDV